MMTAPEPASSARRIWSRSFVIAAEPAMIGLGSSSPTNLVLSVDTIRNTSSGAVDCGYNTRTGYHYHGLSVNIDEGLGVNLDCRCGDFQQAALSGFQ